MSNGSKKLSELSVATTAAGTDRVLILSSPAANGVTKTITVDNLHKQMSGPYANDSTANTGGVVVGQLYYTSAGVVQIRLT